MLHCLRLRDLGDDLNNYLETRYMLHVHTMWTLFINKLSVVIYYTDYPNYLGMMNNVCGKLIKLILNYVTVRNQCHQQIQEALFIPTLLIENTTYSKNSPKVRALFILELFINKHVFAIY